MRMRRPSTVNLNLTTLCRERRLKEAVHILLSTHNPIGDSSSYLQLLQACNGKNGLSQAYRRHGFPHEAITLFHQMQRTGIQPDQFTFASILPACAKIRALEQGVDIHQRIIERGFLSDVAVANSLVDMYARCGSIQKAVELFDKITQKDLISWNAMIAGYTQNGFVEEALETFKQMQLEYLNPNSTTFASILPACAKMGALEQGMDIHIRIIKSGFFSDILVANALIDMYAKCGKIHKAREVLDEMPQRDSVSWNAMIAGYAQSGVLDEALKLFKEIPQRDVVSWTAMIAGYAQNEFVEKALEIFKQMLLAGVKPDSKTFASILPACTKMGALEQGMDIHQRIIESGFLSDIVVMNALIDMYAKCGSIHKACELFDKMPQRNVVSWNTMIAGYTQYGFVERALGTFKQLQSTGVKPESTTFASILPACARTGDLEQGMDIHQWIIESGLLSDVVVANALIDMYAKCGSINKAYKLFDKMPQRDVISWTTMIAGYTQNGFVEEALETFKKMQLASVKPASTTLATILPACSKMGAIEQGMDIHQSIIKNGFLSDVVVANALIDMYAKCGSMHKAHVLFDKMPQKDVISWNAMIAGYAQNGFCKDALELLELMKHSRTYPDHVSFACVLFACSHAGLVDESCNYFNGINDSYCIKPTIDHYMCMVDLLGRAGYLEETLNFIVKMPIKPVVILWTCLLDACRSYKNIRLGVFTATVLFEMDPRSTATYVLLSNIYADVGRWGEVQKVRRLMKDRGITKIPACSWIESHKMIHAFSV
ncbi:pentatricopeptide repeat-containing protein At2g13600-like [Cryptomeria japonica]|uniref:pentatricopeptide repeat-containing protein At2g13600-like n=1 Tax=Cryptomeria japonica TaxID=3369 RepID=UPI0027DA89AF|nr:pentatricopeptide repeat-containing protein At2g13600-like [Cryptomeria japonica]